MAWEGCEVAVSPALTENLVPPGALRCWDVSAWQATAVGGAGLPNLSVGQVGAVYQSPWMLQVQLDGTYDGAAHPSWVWGAQAVDAMPVTAGTTYTWAARAKRWASTATKQVGRLVVSWLDSAGAVLATSASPDTTLLDYDSGDWTTVTGTAAAPAGATQARLSIEHVDLPYPATVYWWRFLLVPAQIATIAPGQLVTATFTADAGATINGWYADWDYDGEVNFNNGQDAITYRPPSSWTSNWSYFTLGDRLTQFTGLGADRAHVDGRSYVVRVAGTALPKPTNDRPARADTAAVTGITGSLTEVYYGLDSYSGNPDAAYSAYSTFEPTVWVTKWGEPDQYPSDWGVQYPSLWWTWTCPPGVTEIVFDTLASSLRNDQGTAINIFTGDPANPTAMTQPVPGVNGHYDPADTNGNSPLSNYSRLSFLAPVAGTTYYIAVVPYAEGTVALRWQAAGAGSDVAPSNAQRFTTHLELDGDIDGRFKMSVPLADPVPTQPPLAVPAAPTVQRITWSGGHLVGGATYEWRIAAYRIDPSHATPPGPATAWTMPADTSPQKGAWLHWPDVPGADGYLIYRKDPGTSNFLLVGVV
jgi:hypothetical protein